MAKKIFVIHGPNLNLLGIRETDIYGSMTLKELNKLVKKYAQSKGVNVKFFQSNHEGKIIDEIHRARNKFDGIIINPGALTHYSYALRDAIAGIGIPTVEVHLSDIHKREDFRKKSVIKDVCVGQISGLGKDSYLQAIDLLIERLS